MFLLSVTYFILTKMYVINKVYLLINFQQIKFKAILAISPVMYNVSL